MNSNTAYLVTCGFLCGYPLLAFLAGFWIARNWHRIDLSALAFWRRDR